MRNKDSFRASISIKGLHLLMEKISKIEGVKAIYLYGSHARGKTHTLSDIDICVIGLENNEYLEKELLGYIKDNIDISYFWRLPLAIRFRVFKEGIPLVIYDKHYINKLKIYTLNNYLDFLPLINRFCIERFGCTI